MIDTLLDDFFSEKLHVMFLRKAETELSRITVEFGFILPQMRYATFLFFFLLFCFLTCDRQFTPPNKYCLVYFS